MMRSLLVVIPQNKSRGSNDLRKEMEDDKDGLSVKGLVSAVQARAEPSLSVFGQSQA